MAGAESPGERTGDFFLLDQANNNLLEKETCKLQVVGKQISYITQIADSKFNTATNLNFMKVKKLRYQHASLKAPRLKKPRNLKLSYFFHESFLLEKPLCFLQMNQISMISMKQA